MKNLLIVLMFFISGQIFGQGSTIHTIQLVDNRLKPMPNTPITLIETTTKQRISQNTDAQGKTTFVLKTGKFWSVNVLEIKNYAIIEIPEKGQAEESSFITYNPYHWQRTHRAPVDRSKMNIEAVDQASVDPKKHSPQEATIKLNIKKGNKLPLADFPVNITCYNLQKTYLAKTNKGGQATFVVPEKQEYEVDIDGVESFSYVDAPRAGIINLEIIYEPTTIIEINKNDTIVQKLTGKETGTSGRTLTTFKVNCSDCDKITEEWIYLQMINSSKVYKAKLNAKGEAVFLLPIKRKYMIHFAYQQDVDVVNLTDVKGISEYNQTVTYRPAPEQKYPWKYLASPDQLLREEFQSFIEKQFPGPKPGDAVGISLAWSNPEVNANAKEAVLQIGFNAPEAIGKTAKEAINICFIIDKSGSMEGHERIDKVKAAMLKYTKQLGKEDIVSLISFDDKFTLLMPSQKLGNGSYLRDMIEDLTAGGGTMMYEGLEAAYLEVLKNMIPKGTNRVVLLTDGYDGVPVEKTVTMSKGYNAKGVELSAIGVGESYNYSLLTLLASKGGGLLQLAGDAKDIDKSFFNELSSVLRPIARDVTVEIEFNNQFVYKQLLGFPAKQEGPGRVKMQMDNVYGGLNKLALVKFELQNLNPEIEKHPVIVRMKYFDKIKNAEAILTAEAYLKWSPLTNKYELFIVEREKKLYAIAITNQSIKAMADAFIKEDYEGLQKAVDSALEQIQKLFPDAQDEDIKALVKRMKIYSTSINRIITVKKSAKKK